MHSSRRAFLTSLACGGLSGLASGRLSADETPELLTVETRRGIARSLAWLAKQQHDDGSYGSTRQHPRDVAITSLAGMAFLAAGDTPGRGRYGQHVSRAVDYVLSCVQPSGFVVSTDSDYHGLMYGHGFATMFLGEAYGMIRRPTLRDRLSRAVKLIVTSQNDEGGWRYEPKPLDADISVTVCQMMALRSARNAGLFVPKETVEACAKYVKRCQNADGGFRYQANGGRPQSRFALSAAGVVGLQSAGVYKAPEVRRGVGYLLSHLPDGRPPDHSQHFFYGHYYAVQAMWHAGGPDWPRWYTTIRDVLLKHASEGSWAHPRGSEYATAMACLILQMPANHLPIFQR